MNVLIPLFSPPTGTWGSLTRVMALANKFVFEGHNVAFCASGYVRKTLDDKGYKTYELPELTMLGLPKSLSNKISKKSQDTTPPFNKKRSIGSAWMLWYALGYSKKKLASIVAAEITAAKDFKADMLLTEMELGSYLTAYILDIPMISTYAKIVNKGIDGFFYKRIRKAFIMTLKKYNLKTNINFTETFFGANILKLIPSIPELDTTNPDRDDVCYTGNMLEPIKNNTADFTPEDGKKYVFCYFGTGSVSLKKAREVLPKVFNQYDDIVCYVGTQSINEPISYGNVHFASYFPAHKILPYCIAFICHGGLNSITQSLEAGVPLIIFPSFIFERRFNAQSVASLGVGYLGELSDFNKTWITDKIASLDTLQTNTSTISQKFKKYHGVDTAYEYIIKWLNKK